MSTRKRGSKRLPRVLLAMTPPASGAQERARARFVRGLQRNFETVFFPGGRPAQVMWKALQRELSGGVFQAAVFVDDDGLRGLINAAGAHFRIPTVVAMLPGGPGQTLDEPPSCSPNEVWDLSASETPRRTEGLFPAAYHSNPRPDAGWIKSRLAALTAGPGEPRVALKLASIIVPCWNNLRYTRECVESVLERTRSPFELILIDNGSADGTPSYLKRLRADKRIKVVLNGRNRGFAKAINQGMRLAKGDYLVWLNNDAVATKGWLERLIACAERSPWIGAVGPLTNECEGIQRLQDAPRLTAKSIPYFAEAFAMCHAGRARLVHRLVGFCFLVKREAVERVGLLDERFGAACYEDFDYSLRLRQAGYGLALAEDAFVYHHGHKSFSGDEQRQQMSSANREVLIEKWCRRSLEFLDDLDPVLASGLAR